MDAPPFATHCLFYIYYLHPRWDLQEGISVVSVFGLLMSAHEHEKRESNALTMH
jgi:hypothetical protein